MPAAIVPIYKALCKGQDVKAFSVAAVPYFIIHPIVPCPRQIVQMHQDFLSAIHCVQIVHSNRGYLCSLQAVV